MIMMLSPLFTHPEILDRHMHRNARAGRPRELLPFYMLLTGLALIGGVVLFSLTRNAGSGSPSTSRVLDAADLADLGDRALGSETAPLTIIEFADFQCPGCAIYAARELPKIKNELVQEGLVRLVFMDFPLPSHPHALLAARAGRCANEQGAFWEFHDRVFAEQANWASEADPTRAFEEYSHALDLDAARFGSCIRSDRHDAQIRASERLGRSIGVRATPSIVANGRLLDGVPTAEGLRRLALEPPTP